VVTLQTPVQAALWLKDRVKGTLTTDSRSLTLGDGFVAWPGAVLDARQFVPDARARGAGACLMEAEGLDEVSFPTDNCASYLGLRRDTGAIAAEFFGNPSEQLSVVAITGTNGKTTTAWWLAQALSALAPTLAYSCGVVGTLGVGTPGSLRPNSTNRDKSASLVETGMTTPDPVVLQKALRGFVAQGLQACALEASSIGLNEHRLNGTKIRVAVFTNFTQDHLDYHRDMDAYWQSKRILFAWPGLQSVVINVDDVKGIELFQTLHDGALDIWTTSVAGLARLSAKNISYQTQGMEFDVVEEGAQICLQTSMFGTYNVSNLLAVLASMRCLGVSLVDAVNACRYLRPVPGRMECFGGEHEPLVAVDYAHTPDALAKAIHALEPLAAQRGGRIWCVFGCGGDRDASKRPLMGAIAAQKADYSIVTSDNPRSEKPEAIIAQVLLGVSQSTAVEVQADRALAIQEAVMRAGSVDVILIAGKGHETTQEIAGVKQPFDDRLHAQQALDLRRSANIGVQK
jgi:UDP-N-acetylmuramoyl-L-alanyl-D-glutamate--2,6-diaminopimelate ligase